MKRLLMFTAILFTVIAFATSYSYANNSTMEQMKDSIRNAVGGAENVVEDAGKDASNGIKDGFNSIGNTTNSAVNGASEVMNNTTSYFSNDNNDGYTARRTATDTTFAGMNGTVWTWLIIGVAAIAIIAFLWYYAMQKTSDTNNNEH